MTTETTKAVTPFNGPVEIGLRALSVLSEAYPDAYSLERLVIFDYFLVHSDDVPGGPTGLHPQTPYRSGELMVRRGVLQDGLLLYQSRGLLDRHYTESGVLLAATERSAAFLDVLETEYAIGLRERASWLVAAYGAIDETELEQIVHEHVGEWGAEFAMESVLWSEDQQ